MALNIELNKERFLRLLGNLIGVAERLQNSPPDLIPEEDLVGDFVLAELKPYTQENGGPLKVERINFAPKRNNIIIEYPGKTKKYVSFVGSHMDVVPANKEEWMRDPFKLTVEGDYLYGRGTTDCLGHIALVTDFFCQLAEIKPELEVSVAAVFIANEENGEIPDIGIDGLMKHGKIDHLKDGVVLWLDSADKQPCIGTGGVVVWELEAIGHPGHSGLPHACINPILLAKDALDYVLKKFHQDFPAHPKESEYGYQAPSTMKPTSWSTPPGGANQIRATATIQGDIRLTPFYKIEEVMKAVERYVEEFNNSVQDIPQPCSAFKYELDPKTRGKVTLKWKCSPARGIACNLESEGFKALQAATTKILGTCKPYSVTGSLPLVGDLQDAGYDIQITGYGEEEYYHAPNERATISGMQEGFKILAEFLNIINENSKH